MWTRQQFKEGAKELLRINYWKMVLVAFVLSLVTGMGSDITEKRNELKNINPIERIQDRQNSLTDIRNSFFSVAASLTGRGNDVIVDIDDVNPTHIFAESGLGIAFILITLIVVVISLALGLLISFVLIYPIQVSCSRFFIKNIDSNGHAEPGEMAYVWKSGKMWNIGFTMFMTNLFIGLWTLLLIVPGIIKAYSYRMVPYILAENPDINWRDALRRSEEMMAGQKLDTFVLDLSFIGWEILSALTLGILGVFYVEPYFLQTKANQYRFFSPEVITVNNASTFDYNTFDNNRYFN